MISVFLWNRKAISAVHYGECPRAKMCVQQSWFPFSSEVGKQYLRLKVMRGVQREVALADPREIPHSGAWRKRISVFLGEEAMQGEVALASPWDIPHSGAWRMRISVFLREEAVQGEAALADPREILHSRAWRRREFHTLEPGECRGRLHWQILETFLTLGPGGEGFPFSSGRRQRRGRQSKVCPGLAGLIG